MSTVPIVTQLEEQSDSEDELLEVLEGVVSSTNEAGSNNPLTSTTPVIRQDSTLTDALENGCSNEVICSDPMEVGRVITISELKKPPTPEPPDLQDLGDREKVAELASVGSIDPYQSLSRALVHLFLLKLIAKFIWASVCFGKCICDVQLTAVYGFGLLWLWPPMASVRLQHVWLLQRVSTAAVRLDCCCSILGCFINHVKQFGAACDVS
ncbi:hypothetical protein RHSIM_RhsimUnG0096700 [Rhododendron simsii]|uniref:Uncharacterized protein n=1 Tax=Rhododendron simsii TaxID=118357 RepID=A0A834FV90_RHOSS|nr:hypothetical protein RHSIM_RhsimUnG0096700 [Rhododendron simsii]